MHSNIIKTYKIYKTRKTHKNLALKTYPGTFWFESRQLDTNMFETVKTH